jgi:hypothetical protein
VPFFGGSCKVFTGERPCVFLAPLVREKKKRGGSTREAFFGRRHGKEKKKKIKQKGGEMLCKGVLVQE